MQNKITRRSLLSLEERQLITSNLLGEFKTKYPQYFNENYKIAEPKFPEKLKKVDLSNKQMAQIPINPIQKSVLSGTCLADSSLRIQPKYKNARIQNRHSSRQASWFFWKWTVCLKDFIKDEKAIQFQDSDGYQSKSQIKDAKVIGKLKIVTKAHSDLTALHSVICKNNRETVSRSWLNHMNDYFLMTVWLDDGSLYNKRQGVICLDSTPEYQQKVFIDYLKSVWEIEAYLQDTKTKMSNGLTRYRICIKDQESLLRLLRIIAPIIPVEEMLYKIMFVPFNNSGLLQRWASEVTELVMPEFRSYISKEYKTIIANYETT
jgi:hypothetical protein